MSDQCKVYKRRPADDGGEYLLIPRDDGATEIPVLPGEPVRLVIPMPDQQNHTPQAANSAEVDAAVQAFFASINKSS